MAQLIEEQVRELEVELQCLVVERNQQASVFAGIGRKVETTSAS